MAVNVPDTGTVGRPVPEVDGAARWLYASCLVLFPLLWGVVGGTDIHPDPSGETAVEQVRAVADSAPAWQQAHLVLAAASLLGIGAVLGLHSLAPRRGRLAIAADVAAAMGVAAAGLVAGLVLAEVVIVAPVARACAEASACLSPTNEAFLARFADSSWSDLTVLSFAAGTLIFSIGALAILGRTTKSVRVWEAALIAIGVIGIYATNTVLHGDAKYGLLVLLVGSTSIAIRMVRRRRNG